MRSTVEVTTDFDGHKRIVIDLNMIDIMKSMPSTMEFEMKKVYEKTGKISDMLMYLSEIFENIETSQKQQKETKR